MRIEQGRELVGRVFENVTNVIRGKNEVVRQALTCWLAGGHVLFEDVPGTGKTIMARALAGSVGAPAKRVQFTPDLMPSDITGTSVYNREQEAFTFIPGPIFTVVLLADEINRATPRTQSALLQAMAEGQCTAENKTYKLPANFFVIATQNPVEQQGTFPLPEAQLDRFMMRLSVGYPSAQAERDIVMAQLESHPIDELKAVVSDEDWAQVRQAVRSVKVGEESVQYALQIVAQTRQHPQLSLGGSPRATIALIRCAQAYALTAGESFVKPDDIKVLAPAILSHRLVPTTKARLERVPIDGLLKDILGSVPVPVR